MGAPKGNTYSSANNRLVANTLRKLAVQEEYKRLHKMCTKIFDKAEEGDIAAATFVADRLDGKPAQSLTIGGDESNPLQTITKIELVGFSQSLAT